MQIDAGPLSSRDAYGLLIDSIVPRAVAWITTLSADGVPNLAPFSFFTGASSSPPTLVFSVSAKVLRGDDGSRSVVAKDTLANLRANGSFIVHTAPAEFREEVIRTADRNLPPEVDEIELVGLDTVPGSWVPVPRIPTLPVAMECRVLKLVEVGEPAATLVIGEVLGWHLRDEVVDEGGRVRSARFGPLGRLGVEGYQGLERAEDLAARLRFKREG